MSYYPDMSSQAAAQGFFDDLLRRTIAAAPLFQRYSGGPPVWIDFGAVVVPAGGSTVPPMNLGGRGLVLALATWTGLAVMSNPPRVSVAGPNVTIYNDTAVTSSCYWVAIAL